MVYKAALPLRRSLIMEIRPGFCSPAGWVAYRCSSVFFLLSLIAGVLPTAPLVAGPMDSGQGAGLLQGLKIFLAFSLSLDHPPHPDHKTQQHTHWQRWRRGGEYSSHPLFFFLHPFLITHTSFFSSYPHSSCFSPAHSKDHIPHNVIRISRNLTIWAETKTDKAQKTIFDKRIILL